MIHKRYLLFFPCLLLIWFIITAVHIGLSDINVKPAQRFLTLWEEDVSMLDETDWNIIFKQVSKANVQNPLNPELLIIMANIQEWKIYLDDSTGNNNYYLSIALENYKKAAELNPTWPYIWSHISLVKFRIGEIDPEFKQAVENAVTTGPWEPGVQKIIAEVGLGVWDKLNLDMREKVIRNIYRGIAMHPVPMLNILNKYGQLRLVCYKKNNDPVVTKYCEKNNIS